MKIESGTILQNLRIPQKLLKIFTLGTLTNLSLVNQQYAKVEKKEVENLRFFFIRLREHASKQGGNVMIPSHVLSVLLVIYIYLLLWEPESLVSVFVIAARISFSRYI